MLVNAAEEEDPVWRRATKTPHDPTPSRISSTQTRRNAIRGITAALAVLAVAWLLLAPAASGASLLAEVPDGHWSYEAVERLADAGIVDPLPQRGARLPVDRYELARRVAEARALVDGAISLEFDAGRFPGNSARGVKVRAVAGELLVARMRALLDALESSGLEVAREEISTGYGNGRTGTAAHLDTAALARELRVLIDSTVARYEELYTEIARVWPLDGRGKVASGDLDLEAAAATLEEIAAGAARGIERVLAAGPAELSTFWTDHAGVKTADIFQSWLRWERALGKSGDAPDQVNGAQVRARELARSFEELEAEFAPELALISPGSEAYGRAVVPGALVMQQAALQSSAAPSIEFDRDDAGTAGTRSGIGVAIDRLLAGVTARAGVDRDKTGASYGWTPAPGLSSQARANDLVTLAESTKVGAEYPVTLMGVEIRAGLGVEAAPSGAARGAEATLEASVPVFGSRVGIGASYTVVDLDRLYEVTSIGRSGAGGEAKAVGGGATGGVASGGASGRSAPNGRTGDDKVQTVAIGGTLPLGESASIKVGYEFLKEAGRIAGGSDGVLGAGVEYYIGSRGRVRAEYQWGTAGEGRASSAGVDIGYRFGEHTSLSASYALIQFDTSGGAYRDNLGEAKLELRF